MKSETHPNFHFKRRKTKTQARNTPGCPQGVGSGGTAGGFLFLLLHLCVPPKIISWNTSILIIVCSPGPRLSPGPSAQRAPMSPCPRGDTASFPTFSLTFRSFL